MIRINNKRGRLIFKAKNKEWWRNTRHEQLIVFSGYLICVFVSGYLLTIPFTYGLRQHSVYFYVGSTMLFITTLLLLIFGLLALYFIPFETDAIYEKGFSSSNHTFVDFLRRKTFHQYSKIKKVCITRSTVRESKGGVKRIKIEIYEKDKDRPVVSFEEEILFGEPKYYTNDFLNVLLKTLKEKCPNASWTDRTIEENPKSTENLVETTNQNVQTFSVGSLQPIPSVCWNSIKKYVEVIKTRGGVIIKNKLFKVEKIYQITGTGIIFSGAVFALVFSFIEGLMIANSIGLFLALGFFSFLLFGLGWAIYLVCEYSLPPKMIIIRDNIIEIIREKKRKLTYKVEDIVTYGYYVGEKYNSPISLNPDGFVLMIKTKDGEVTDLSILNIGMKCLLVEFLNKKEIPLDRKLVELVKKFRN